MKCSAVGYRSPSTSKGAGHHCERQGFVFLCVLCASVAVLLPMLPGCRPASPSTGPELRLATTEPGERMRGPFQAALRGFEHAHPGVHVQVTTMDDEVYQQMGLLTLFVGGTPPDVYFQWGGHLVRKYAAAGYALDLSAEFPPAE